MNDTHIIIAGVSKVFQTADRELVALNDIELEIPRGQFTCLLGPSGCGKSTLLNAVAGFSLPSAGTISCDGKLVTEPGPDRGMVFQEYALFPWMTVEDNIGFGLQIKGIGKAEIRQRVDALLAMLSLSDFRTRFPKDLSGGMRQRVERRADAPQPAGRAAAHLGRAEEDHPLRYPQHRRSDLPGRPDRRHDVPAGHGQARHHRRAAARARPGLARVQRPQARAGPAGNGGAAAPPPRRTAHGRRRLSNLAN
jgi:hypothetical protein